MGAIKEKLFEIAEIIQQMLDEGVKDFEVDEYLEAQLTPEDYQFYHQNKDVIFQHFLGYMNESANESNNAHDTSLVGKVFKMAWPWGEISYYMVLDDSYISKDSEKRLYLTTSLATSSRNGNWLVPYKDDIYHEKGEKQGSQVSGYANLSEYKPINEKDKQKLIRLFSKPRYLSYLEEIFEDEGIVPDFLKPLLDSTNESLTPRNPHINRNIEEDDPRWIDPHEWDRHRRFKEKELSYELAGEDECPTCGRQLDDSGHCRRCERRNESEFMMPSIFGKSLNEAKRDWTKDDAKRHGLENLWQDHDEDSFDEQEFLDNDADWTFQEGDEVIFDIEDMEMEWREDEEQGEIAISHSGQVAVIVAQVTATKIGDKDYEYYDIEFGDGTILDAVSGYHLKPAYEKPDISPAGEPDINFKNIRKYRNPYRESKEELMMPSLFEGCGCGKKRVGATPIRRPAPPIKLPVPPKSPNPRLK